MPPVPRQLLLGSENAESNNGQTSKSTNLDGSKQMVRQMAKNSVGMKN